MKVKTMALCSLQASIPRVCPQLCGQGGRLKLSQDWRDIWRGRSVNPGTSWKNVRKLEMSTIRLSVINSHSPRVFIVVLVWHLSAYFPSKTTPCDL